MNWKLVGNEKNLDTQIGLEDRDGNTSEERSRVSVDVEIEKLKML